VCFGGHTAKISVPLRAPRGMVYKLRPEEYGGGRTPIRGCGRWTRLSQGVTGGLRNGRMQEMCRRKTFTRAG
jgi:hypothetical protein